MPTFSLTSLGCAKNLVNSEQMLYLLQEAGYSMLPEPDGADYISVCIPGFDMKLAHREGMEDVQ